MVTTTHYRSRVFYNNNDNNFKLNKMDTKEIEVINKVCTALNSTVKEAEESSKILSKLEANIKRTNRKLGFVIVTIILLTASMYLRDKMLRSAYNSSQDVEIVWTPSFKTTK